VSQDLVQIGQDGLFWVVSQLVCVEESNRVPAKIISESGTTAGSGMSKQPRDQTHQLVQVPFSESERDPSTDTKRER
jgi:hypothetical protein